MLTLKQFKKHLPNVTVRISTGEAKGIYVAKVCKERDGRCAKLQWELPTNILASVHINWFTVLKYYNEGKAVIVQ